MPACHVHVRHCLRAAPTWWFPAVQLQLGCILLSCFDLAATQPQLRAASTCHRQPGQATHSFYDVSSATVQARRALRSFYDVSSAMIQTRRATRSVYNDNRDDSNELCASAATASDFSLSRHGFIDSDCIINAETAKFLIQLNFVLHILASPSP